ncbi:hypothetical protein VP489E541_P0026 [Vibrio phage 489E54-1]|nr:hypothetical protein VP489E541_P0026 [Vibrio phage 489E54-1]
MTILVSGQLYNKDCTPTSNGCINILGSTGVAIYHADQDGFYSFELPEGEYNINVPISDRFFSGKVKVTSDFPDTLSVFELVMNYGEVTETPH